MTTQAPPSRAASPKLAPRATPRTRGRNVIAVASGKGGVGKTWFSVTLTHALARLGRKCLLFDGDMGLANVDIQLGLMPKHDLASVITRKITLNQAAIPYTDGGFEVIAGRSGSGSLANIPLARLQILADDLRVVAASYDHVIIDLGAGVERPVRELAGMAGTVLLVCTDEPTSLTDAYAFVKVMAMDHLADEIRVVVNAANSTREGERTYNTLLKACNGFLGVNPPLAGVVRRDNRVRESIRNQMPIMARYPTAEAAADVDAIARRLLAG